MWVHTRILVQFPLIYVCFRYVFPCFLHLLRRTVQYAFPKICTAMCHVSVIENSFETLFILLIQSRGEERDREDAISFASRKSHRQSSLASSHRRHSQSQPQRHRHRSSSKQRSLGAASSSNVLTKTKYPPGDLGPSGTTYNLWSSRHSLRREHKRKFNRSLCGVLLGVSIVLVILGILGIIGIAVYLGGTPSSSCKRRENSPTGISAVHVC